MEMTTERVEDSSETSGSDMEEEEFNGKIRELKKYVSCLQPQNVNLKLK